MRARTHSPLLAAVLCLLAACAHETYPPAFPAEIDVPWAPKNRNPTQRINPMECPPWHPWHPLLSVIPVGEDWSLWEPVTAAKQVCTGTGKRRKCRTVKQDPTTQANQGALVKPDLSHTQGGTSAQTRYPLDGSRERIYKIVTSKQEATYLLLPAGERLAAKLFLNPSQWEVAYGEQRSDARNETVVVKPAPESNPPFNARGMLVFQSGLTLHLFLEAREKPGMLSVSWDLPPPVVPPPPPPDQLPPVFNKDKAYAGYTVTLEEGQKPPWYPTGAVDDGKNTMIRFPTQFDGIRLPVVQGIQQNGSPALVQSRFYQRPEHGAWIYIQGLWPALQVKDAAGITVKLIRRPPKQAQGGWQTTDWQ